MWLGLFKQDYSSNVFQQGLCALMTLFYLFEDVSGPAEKFEFLQKHGKEVCRFIKLSLKRVYNCGKEVSFFPGEDRYLRR